MLKPLVLGDRVMFKKTANEWVYGYGLVTDIANDRSYIVKTATNDFFRRNRRFIVRSNNCPAVGLDDYDFLDESNVIDTPNKNAQPVVTAPVPEPADSQPPAMLNNPATVEPGQNRSRFGRLIQTPIRFGDWISH